MLYSITIFVALTGNLLLIFIVTRRPETRTLTCFLFVNMAAADLLVTLVVMPVSMAIPYTEMRWLSGTAGHITCKMVYFAFHVTIAASIISLTLMSVDRYLGIVVVFPFDRFQSFRRAKVLTVVIWLTSIIFMIPAAVLWKIEKGVQEGTWYCQPAFAEFGKFQTGVRVYYTYLFLLAYFIPLLVISVLYGVVCCKLWHRTIPAGAVRLSVFEIVENHEAKKKIVRMLVIITAAFAICWLPAQLYHLLWAIDYGFTLKFPRYVMFVSMWCGHANSALNPWLYMLFNVIFRKALRDVFGGRCSRLRTFTSSFKAQSTSTRATSLVMEPNSVRKQSPRNLRDKRNGSEKEKPAEIAI